MVDIIGAINGWGFANIFGAWNETKAAKKEQLTQSGGIPTPVKNMKVKWDDYIPNIYRKKNMIQTTNQQCVSLRDYWLLTTVTKIGIYSPIFATKKTTNTLSFNEGQTTIGLDFQFFWIWPAWNSKGYS